MRGLVAKDEWVSAVVYSKSYRISLEVCCNNLHLIFWHDAVLGNRRFYRLPNLYRQGAFETAWIGVYNILRFHSRKGHEL